ncbi:esterase LipI-like isoform X2 [Dreissena polymorpha]|nr:esterase LipI-like isoform X2 [Dreissena polymorpha]
MGSLGLVEPFSETDRKWGDMLVRAMTTGVPWVQEADPALKITDMFTSKSRVPVRMYEPLTTIEAGARPVLVYLHGGGFSLLSIDAYDSFTRKVARDSGLVVVSVDYRLSPQHPYPAATDDCLEVVQYLHAEASRLRIDPRRIAIGGDSAGGNLAASVSLKARELIKAQLLLVPALQLFTFNTTSVIENKPYFAKTFNGLFQVIFWANYLGLGAEYAPDIIANNHTSPELKRSKFANYVDQTVWMKSYDNRGSQKKDLSQKLNFGRSDITREFIDKMTDPYVSPLMADPEMLVGLPRAYIMTAGYDIIRDDGIMYATRLRQAGVPTHLINYKTSFHTALTFSEGPLSLNIARQTVSDIVSFLHDHV